MVASVALVLIAIYLARMFYNKRPELATDFREKLSGIHRVLLNKYYVDEIYGAILVRPVVYLSLFLWKMVDVVFIDGLINGLATSYSDVSQFLRGVQTGRVRSYATLFVIGVLVLMAYVVLR